MSSALTEEEILRSLQGRLPASCYTTHTVLYMQKADKMFVWLTIILESLWETMEAI